MLLVIELFLEKGMEFKSKCINCGELEFDESDRVWNEDETCYCRCGQKLKYTGDYSEKTNTVGFNEKSN
jgi:hypothetical protein